MKQFWREAGLAVILGMIMPGIILQIVTYGAHKHVRNGGYSSESTQEPTAATESLLYIPVLVDDETVTQIELDDYVTGVVLAEMPASFEDEALKAQSVVARTYTLRAFEGKSKHDSAAVCMDFTCCQAYESTEDYLKDGGSRLNVDKVRAAVSATKDLVLTYEGELIEATYFSCSGGSTEDAVAVWGSEVPYLQSVSSPGEENAAYFTDTVSFGREELADALDLSLDGEASDWFGQITYTAGGGVATIDIGGKAFKGTKLRKLLGLRSTAFTITTEGDTVTFHTKGFGHRVGMSQYGADAMAASGNSFEEILSHYYQGTTLVRRSD